jgi:hypothetical protein
MKTGPALLLALVLSACTSPVEKAEQHDDMLTKAGFQYRTADSARKITFMKALPAHKFITKMINGKPVYLYSDPLVCRCIYFGNEDDWNRYQKIRFDAGIAAQRAETRGLYEMIEYNGDDWGYF